MNEVYELYKEQHPEELRDLNRIKHYSGHIEEQRERRRVKKLKRIEECRRRLYGDSDE